MLLRKKKGCIKKIIKMDNTEIVEQTETPIAKMNEISNKINELIEEFNAISGNMCIMPLCYSSR